MPAIPLALALILAAPQTYDISDLPFPAGPTTSAGRSLELDGTRGIVGGKGEVWIVERQPSGRFEVVATLDPGLPDDAGFGREVALDGSRAVIGAPFDSVTAFRSGSVFVYERGSDGTWKVGAKLFLPNGAVDDFFGWSVALDGDRIVVGRPRSASPFDPGVESGTIHVYDRLASGHWVLDATLGAPSAVDGAWLGDAVDVEGDRVVAGAPSPTSVDRIGRAWVFDRDPGGFWVQSAELDPSNEPNAQVGSALSLDGDRVAVGASQSDAAILEGGAIWIYERNGQGDWKETQLLTAPVAGSNASFGADVELRGEILVGGAPNDEVPGIPSSGAAHLFRLLPGGQWTWVERLLHSDVEVADFSGRSVALGDGWVGMGSPSSDSVHVLYAYAASADHEPIPYGLGTPGCDGPLALATNLPPLVASGEFQLLTEGLPASVSGLALISLAQDAAGSDPFDQGITLHVDLLASPVLLLLDSQADATGLGITPLPIPSDPALTGAKLFTQTVWFVPPCAANPLGLASSPGLAVFVGEP